jgi:hypothetical protein
MSSVSLAIKLRQIAAAMLLAPRVGVLSSLPIHTPAASWGM